MLKADRILCGSGMAAGLSGLLIIGPITALGQTTVIEDFEGFTVPVVLDPTTVGGSGWTRGGVDPSDWDVICCDGDIGSLDRTFDGSPQFLALRRSNANPPSSSDENTDFAIPTIVQGSVSLEMNPASPGSAGFRMSLHDSGSSIGPAKNSLGATLPLGDPARGLVLTLTGANLPVPSVDTFRLTTGSTNGGGLQPTLIDNIIARDFFGTVDVDDIKTGEEISFPTLAGGVYQPQFSDDGSTWSDLGALVLGEGTTQSVVASTTGAPANRTYRVLEF